MVESAKRPSLEDLSQLMVMFEAHAKERGYDMVMALMQVVDAFNRQERHRLGAKRSKLGAMGFYPNNGRPLNPDDNGAVMALIEKRSDGIVYADMGQMVVNWFALAPDGARDFGKRMIAAADEPTPPPARSGHPTLPGLP